MEVYKKDLQQFRRETPLKLLCQSQTKRCVDHSPGFREVAVQFDWPDTITLEVVESFRQEYACFLNLCECAMMLACISIGSFIATWFVPESALEQMKMDLGEELISKYTIVKLEVNGECVYPKEYHKQVKH